MYHLPTIAYAAAIILVSSIPNMAAPKFKFLLFDKLAHLVEYAVFAFLAFRSISNAGRQAIRSRAFMLSILFLSLFAVLDEFYQHFVPGRHSDVYDLVGDMVGALIVLAYLRLRRTGQAES